jgi:hypothetical protein
VKNLLWFRRGRYALASLALAGGVVAAAACQPTKTPPPPPPKTCEPGGGGACLTITPDAANFFLGTINTFTVTNTGPDQSLRLHETVLDEAGVGGSLVFLINSGPGANTANPDDCQDFHPNGLVRGDKCTIKVIAAGDPGDRGTLVVGSENTQLDPLTGLRGVSAQLTRN